MTSTNHIHTTVLQRVRTIHAIRAWFSVSSVAFVALIFAVWAIGREVWVARVFHNMPPLTNVSALLRFYAAAFVDTRQIVQVLALLAVLSAGWIIFASVRSIVKTSGSYNGMTLTRST